MNNVNTNIMKKTINTLFALAFASANFAADYTYDAVSSTTPKSFEEIANAVGAPAFDASTNLTINITKDSEDWFKTTSANTTLNSFTIKIE